MDRRTILAIVISAAIYYAWLAVRGPQLQAEAEAEAEAAAQAEATQVDQPNEPPPAPVNPTPPELVGDFPEEEVSFSACDSKSTVSTTDGLSDLYLLNHEGPYDVQPLYSWIWGLFTGSSDGGWHPWGAEAPGPATVFSPDARILTVGTGRGPRDAAPARLRVVENREGVLTLQGMTADGIEVTQKLTENRTDDQCVIDVELTWRNPTGATYDGGLWVGMHELATDGSGGMAARYSSMRQPTTVVDGSLNYGGPTAAGCVSSGTRLSDEDGEREFPLEGPVSWIGVSDRYFGMYLVPESADAPSAWFSRLGEGEQALDGVHLAYSVPLAAGATRTERYTSYVGSNDLDALDAVHEHLSYVVDLGWFSFFGTPLLWMLRLFYAGFGNWGFAIVMVTFVIKVVFFPMTQRSFRSMQKMQKIQPELNRVREEYADNPQEQQRKLFEVMQQHQVNPAAGCLPMLVQFPVWIALYNVLLTNVDLYHTEFLYLKDLTQPDPYLIMPITIMGLMFLQQRFTTPNTANMDPQQQQQQQIMRIMPLFFGLLFFAFPSGLAVYVFVNMVLSILQQWLIKRSMDNEGTAAPAGAAASS